MTLPLKLSQNLLHVQFYMGYESLTNNVPACMWKIAPLFKPLIPSEMHESVL
jgi:hypothetical protein